MQTLKCFDVKQISEKCIKTASDNRAVIIARMFFFMKDAKVGDFAQFHAYI
jgi:hypothetical protein